MTEYKNVGTIGHVGHESGVLWKEAATAICPTGHEAFHTVLNQKKSLIQNNEPWRGKGKRRMPKWS